MSATPAESEAALARARADACCECCRLKADLANANATIAELRSSLNAAQSMVAILSADLERERDKGITWK